MLTAWLGGLGTKLTESWAGRALSPAVLFWLGGLAAFALGPGGDRRLSGTQNAFDGAPLILQVLAVVAAVAVVAASEEVSQGLSLGVTRLLEGYWPRLLGPFRRSLVGRTSRASDRDRGSWNALNCKMDAEGIGALSDEERLEYGRLEFRLRRVPFASGARMPTRVGNIMRAAETRIAERYGLDPRMCWPSFWLVLPELARKEIADARAAVDARIQAWFWAFLFCLWTPVMCLLMPVTWWWPWPLLFIGLAVAAIVYYGWLVPTAATYAELLDTAFGLYRAELYKAFGQKAPTDPDDERAAGLSLTEYIWHGLLGELARKATRRKSQKANEQDLHG